MIGFAKKKSAFFAALACLVLFIPSLGFAQRTRLAAALIDEQVLVTSSFNGAKITMFGAYQSTNQKVPDIVVIVRGPDRPAWVSEKIPIAGLWVGQTRIKFEAAPTFFGVASTRPLSEIAPNDTLNLYGLTAQSQLAVDSEHQNSPILTKLKNAYVTEREKQRRYLRRSYGVRLVEGGLFRADLRMPDLTPPGLYTVKVMVFRNGRPVDSSLTTLVVSKVGIERTIYEFAQRHKLLYALIGVLVALTAGFFSARIFNRFTNA